MIQAYGRDSVLIENVECLSESGTGQSLIVVLEEDHDEHIIPKSQIHADSDIHETGDSGNLIITKWLAEKRGIWREGE